MNLNYIFSKKNILADLRVDTKYQVISELVENIFTESIEKSNNDLKSELISSFMEREKLGSTGLQYGIAIPHIKSNFSEKIYVSVGIHRKGVDFDALDNHPAQIIILSVVPFNKSMEHLKFLSDLSRALFQDTEREKILKAQHEDEIFEFVKNKISN